MRTFRIYAYVQSTICAEALGAPPKRCARWLRRFNQQLRKSALVVALAGCSGSSPPPQVEVDASFVAPPPDAGRKLEANVASKPCHPGALACAELQPTICGADGAWEDVGGACSGGCVKGACTACAPGSTKCSGDSVMACSTSGTWGAAVPCAVPTSSCAAGTCIVPTVTGWECSIDGVNMCACQRADGGTSSLDWCSEQYQSCTYISTACTCDMGGPPPDGGPAPCPPVT